MNAGCPAPRTDLVSVSDFSMKTTSLRLAVMVLVVQAGALVTQGKDAPPVRTMPALKLDSTPISQTKSSTVASYADVIEPVQSAVVSVYSKKIVRERVAINPLLRQFFGDNLPEQERARPEEGLGSGVIVSPDGYILTNNHVVEGADELKVLLSDERELIAKVIGADPKTDIAVIKIDAERLPVVTLADSDNIRVGDVVFAVGNPLGVGQTVTMGIVSAKGRSVGILEEVAGYESFIQTDAAINMGNSGGALVDARGRLVGINSAILSPSRGNIGIGFAVPVNLAATVMHSLIETGSVSRGYLGVASQTLSADHAEALGLNRNTKGVMVTDVYPGTPAETAGLKRGDVITSINEKAVTSLRDLRVLIAQSAPGSKVKLKVSRDGKDRLVEASLGKLDEKPNEILSGIEVTPLTPDARRRLNIPARLNGLLVTTVSDDSDFADRLAPDVLILQIDREDVSDLESARKALTPGRHMLFVYFRGALRVVGVEVK